MYNRHGCLPKQTIYTYLYITQQTWLSVCPYSNKCVFRDSMTQVNSLVLFYLI